MKPTTINILHIVDDVGIVKIKKNDSKHRTHRLEEVFEEIKNLKNYNCYVKGDELIIVSNKHKITSFLV